MQGNSAVWAAGPASFFADSEKFNQLVRTVDASPCGEQRHAFDRSGFGKFPGHFVRRDRPFVREPAVRDAGLERFRVKWAPVRVKKTRQNKKLEPRSDSIGTEKALARFWTQKAGLAKAEPKAAWAH
jgi:hypothetical protein